MNTRSFALNNVSKVHNAQCDCDFNIRYGLVKVGSKCAASRMDYLSKNVMRPGHTKKTDGVVSDARLNRSRLRGYMWSAENDSTRRDATNDYEASLSPEYKAQVAGTHHNHRKKASGKSATKLGLAA